MGFKPGIQSDRRTQIKIFDNTMLKEIFGPKRQEVASA
jgi:hypothetical protein